MTNETKKAGIGSDVPATDKMKWLIERAKDAWHQAYGFDCPFPMPPGTGVSTAQHKPIPATSKEQPDKSSEVHVLSRSVVDKAFKDLGWTGHYPDFEPIVATPATTEVARSVPYSFECGFELGLSQDDICFLINLVVDAKQLMLPAIGFGTHKKLIKKLASMLK